MDVYVRIISVTFISFLLTLSKPSLAEIIQPKIFNEKTFQDFKCVVDNYVAREELITFVKSIKSAKRHPEGEFFVELDREYESSFGNAFAVMDNVIISLKNAPDPNLKNIFIISPKGESLTVSVVSPFRLKGEISCIKTQVTFKSLSEIIQPTVFTEETYQDFKCVADTSVGREDLMVFIKSLRSFERHPEGEYFVKLGREYTSALGTAFAVMDEIVVYKRKPPKPGFKDIYLFSPGENQLTVSYISPVQLNGEIFCIQTQTTLENNNHNSKLLSIVD